MKPQGVQRSALRFSRLKYHWTTATAMSSWPSAAMNSTVQKKAKTM
jgi:hypothetical protein